MDGATIEIEDVDMVDGTPLLDIKPYVPAFDQREECESAGPPGAAADWWRWGRVGLPVAKPPPELGFVWSGRA